MGAVAQLSALLPTRSLAVWVALHIALSQVEWDALPNLLVGKLARRFFRASRLLPPNPVEPANFQHKSIKELFFPLYDLAGNLTTWQMSLPLHSETEQNRDIIIDLATDDISIEQQPLKPRFQRAMIIGWDAVLPEPEEKAIEDVKAVFIIQNVVGQKRSDISFNEGIQRLPDEANKLLTEFNNLLDSSNREEELQIFLAEHPQFLYPDVRECFPKFGLGNDFITDYVFAVQGLQGFE